MSVSVRRVRADEWQRVRDLRLDAVRDPLASIAFLTSYEAEAERPDEFWQDRAANSADGDTVAQFVAESNGDWVGTVTVIRRNAGDTDHHGRVVTAPRGDVVGVFVRPEHRAAGIIDTLLSAAAEWARALGDGALALDVHVDNDRAQAAYRRAGFVDTGARFTASIGPETEMTRSLVDAAGVSS
ncbi:MULTISPECIES: GNAT family N-acetyltransferase [unclassified Microbacterium]|uniref:GNAT family N-acetyltransferase n=1 Tax=unclassified Microbacterium TaxID=2609290 RepID=UPI000EA93887|nr:MULTISPECIES: GNAT family N-acetyltransferase [unclassified Microbacterium]MBT2485984.1 GNAT family N-acetyltransferase [Microbacterium sp. ISL-108]RKN68729.1 GNAT family N-acetyltransferase [Microbacterium sp. CGR2]